MLPDKIINMLSRLKNKTEDGSLQWQYFDDEDKVIAKTEKFEIMITYRFNHDEEVGQFNINYTNFLKNKTYSFSTNQNYNDYENVRMLFDEAQSSDLDLDDFEI